VGEPVVAFCTTCKNRTYHLKQTLPKNLEDNPGPNSKFVVLNYGSQDDFEEYVSNFHGKDIASGKLAVYNFPGAMGSFRIAHAKNMAHRLGILEGADVLVNLDADNMTGPGFGDYVSTLFASKHGAPIFLWGNMIKGVLPRGISGRIATSKNAFIKAGGYDEKFETWAPDDKDFNFRLRQLGYTGIEIDTKYLQAVRHNDKIRFKEYPHAKDGAAHYEYSQKDRSGTSVVNFGNVGCGIVFRNMNYDTSLRLSPFPTRIFGIGMHKTATTSLHQAFDILGLNSAHWKSAHWAKAIWREMNNLGYSPTLERNYSLCDLPFPVLFRKLDAAYPGSKFILTTRDEMGWLDTVGKHWDPNFNKFRSGWDNDPFTNRMHKIVYKRQDFNAIDFLNRYRRHNTEVQEYFRDRPNDLLVMPMDEGAGWPELCNFLGLPIPEVPYPRAYSAY